MTAARAVGLVEARITDGKLAARAKRGEHSRIEADAIHVSDERRKWRVVHEHDRRT